MKVKSLLMKYSLDSIFLSACYGSHIPVLRELIEYYRFDINKLIVVNKDANLELTGLMIACREANLPLVEFFLSFEDINVKVKDISGYTALHYVFAKKCEPIILQIVKKLIQKGADINARTNDNSFTPLVLAVTKGYFSIVKLLVENNVYLFQQLSAGGPVDIRYFAKGANPVISEYIDRACRTDSLRRATQIRAFKENRVTNYGSSDISNREPETDCCCTIS